MAKSGEKSGGKAGIKKRPAPSQQRGAVKGSPPKKPKMFGRGHAAETKAAPVTRKEKKELVRERKARKHKNFSLIQEVVTLWEDLRRHDLGTEKRSKLITAVLGKVKGRIAELAASHTAARVIQTCAKYGSAAERAAILEELSPKLLDLSKSSYGHFVVSKLISLAPKDQLPGILKQFRGQIPTLLRHPAGAHVVDDLWAVADPKQRNAMAAEFYGREYVLFEGGTINNASGAPAHLRDLLSGVDGAKRRSVIQHMAKDLIPIMEKGLVDPPLVHRLVSEYLEASPASLVADAVESLAGEALLHMVHTKEGARAACMVLAYGTAKERKKAVKAMKGHVGTMARDEWGHLVLITALSVVDDTALLKKFVVGDLQKDIEELCAHRYAHRVVLQLLHPYCPRYLPPQLLAIVQPPQKVYEPAPGAKAATAGEGSIDGEDGEAAKQGGEQQLGSDSDEEGAGPSRPTSGPLGVSKKDGDTRRRELFGSGASGLGGVLAKLCAARANALLRSQAACDVVVEVCRGGEGALLEACVGEEALGKVHDAVAAAVASGSGAAAEGNCEEGEGEQEEGGGAGEPLLEQFFASRALRRLVLSSAAEDTSQSATVHCVERLWAGGGLAGGCSRWVGGHGAKVLAAFVRCGSPSVRSAAAKELAPLVRPQTVESWAEQLTAGGERLEGGKQRQQGGAKRKAGAQQQQRRQNGTQQPKQQAEGKTQKAQQQQHKKQKK